MRIAIYNHGAAAIVASFTTVGDEPFARRKYVFANGASIRPIALGWENDPDVIPGNYEVLEVTPFEAPEGKEATGEPSYAIADGKLVESFAVEDIPQPIPTDYPLKRYEFQAMIRYLDIDAAVRGAIAAISDDLDREIALSRYEASDLYHRDDELLATLAVAIGMSDAQIDDAWTQIVGKR